MDDCEKRHEDLVEKVAKCLMNRGYEEVYKHTYYGNKGVTGEIDLFVRYKDSYIVFEVKGTDTVQHYNKARKQLFRAEKYAFTGSRCFLFYVYGNIYGEPEYKRIRRNKKC